MIQFFYKRNEKLTSIHIVIIQNLKDIYKRFLPEASL